MTNLAGALFMHTLFPRSGEIARVLTSCFRSVLQHVSASGWWTSIVLNLVRRSRCLGPQAENAAQALCSSEWSVVYFVIPTIVNTFWKCGLRPKVWMVWPVLLAAIII
jgi:hypothetical protein